MKPKTCLSCQIAIGRENGIVRWMVENIMVFFNTLTHKWSYEVLEYDDVTDEWNGYAVSFAEARRLCDIELPIKFYE